LRIGAQIVFLTLCIWIIYKTYWQTKYSVSFPRLRPAEGTVPPNFIMDDRDLTQLICAYRLWNEDLEFRFRHERMKTLETTLSQLEPQA
jgi:2-iminoacetate synthase ThiH